MRIRQWRWTIAVPAVVLAAALAPSAASALQAGPAAGSSGGSALKCGSAAHSFNCADVYDPNAVGYDGGYIGHDEPSELFYSNVPGSGNNDSYLMRLPKDPRTPPSQDGTGGTDNFMLHPAFWVGMALCDSQSFPEATQTCNPDTDSNIFNSPDPSSPRYIGNHPGTAFMEMQFYPPGWVPWPAGNSCAATQYCAALNIDSFSSNPAGVNNNSTCLNSVGVEPVNFAFITRNGHSQAPANPVDATAATFTPEPGDLFMNPGDVVSVNMHDTPAGFQVVITDFTTHQSGSMTASIANGFGQVDYQPNSTTCNVTPYAFHPMYSTSGVNTRVPWTAHSYNIAFSDEIGHFEYCNTVDTTTGACTSAGVTETNGQTDSDDVGCFPASDSTLYQISGCLGADGDFDGPPYLNDWPGTGSPGHDARLDSQPIEFTTPVFDGFHRYSQVAFESDMPRIEYPDFGGTCNFATGANCVNPPPGAQFYPIYTTTHQSIFSGSGDAALTRDFGQACVWREGGANMPGTADKFGGSSTTEYKNLLQLFYPTVVNGQPAAQFKFEDFRQILPDNPC